MNTHLRQGLEKFLVWYLDNSTAQHTASSPDALRQAFCDELNERTDQFISDQDWDENFSLVCLDKAAGDEYSRCGGVQSHDTNSAAV